MDEVYNDSMYIYLNGLDKPILIDTKNIIRILSDSKCKWRLIGHIENKKCIVTQWKVSFKRKTLSLARIILNKLRGNHQIDHKNCDSFDNRGENLRECSNQENNCNKVKCLKIKTSKFKGVSLIKGKNKFRAYIKVDSNQIFLGEFYLEVDAALAYDDAALKYFGEFAKTNRQLGLL